VWSTLEQLAVGHHLTSLRVIVNILEEGECIHCLCLGCSCSGIPVRDPNQSTTAVSCVRRVGTKLAVLTDRNPSVSWTSYTVCHPSPYKQN